MSSTILSASSTLMDAEPATVRWCASTTKAPMALAAVGRDRPSAKSSETSIWIFFTLFDASSRRKPSSAARRSMNPFVTDGARRAQRRLRAVASFMVSATASQHLYTRVGGSEGARAEPTVGPVPRSGGSRDHFAFGSTTESRSVSASMPSSTTYQMRFQSAFTAVVRRVRAATTSSGNLRTTRS